MGRTGMRAVKLGRRLSAERQMFEFFELGIRPFADGASEPQIVIADTLPLDFAAGFDGAGGLGDQSQDRFSLAVMRVKVSHTGELITLGWGIPAKEEKERPVFSYFFYDGSAAEHSSGPDVTIAGLGSAVAADKNIFTFYHSPILEMGGVSPATLGKALGLSVPELESADSPLDVARAKLALAQKGWDA
jgi:hypothetical protein